MVSGDIVQRFWSKTKRNTNGCLIWTAGKTRDGYGHFHVKRKDWRAHRFAYFITQGSIDPKSVIRHLCDEPLCVNPAHLQSGTQKENIADMFKRERNPTIDHRGERHPGHKLTEEDVKAIRSSSESTSALAQKYKVTYQTIYQARTGRTWKHVT